MSHKTNWLEQNDRMRYLVQPLSIQTTQTDIAGQHQPIPTSLLPATSTQPSLLNQLRMRRRRLINLFNDGRRPVRAHLCKAAQITSIEAKRNDGVSTTALRLGYYARDGVVAGVVQLLLCQTTLSLSLALIHSRQRWEGTVGTRKRRREEK